jgi:hypothetical protein
LPPYKWFASTDPQGKNEDYILLKPGETRRVPLSAGKLIRLWSTASQPEKVVLSLSNGSTTTLMRDNIAQAGELYEKAFTLYPTATTARALRDLKSNAALVVTNRDTQANKWFYQVTVRQRSVDASSVNGNEGEDQPQQNIPVGQETTLFSSESAGLLRMLTIDVDTMSADVLRNLRLRATWDRGAKPAVDVPLLALTGQFFSASPVQSFGWKISPGPSRTRLDLTFPMPHGAGARVSLVNNSATAVRVSANASVQTARNNRLPSNYRFCAQYGSSRTQNGQPVQMLRVLGSGAFVGLSLGISPTPDTTRRAFAYLEGNETITADGQKFEGTGAEDFFNSAWYFPAKSFARPYHGMTYKNELPPQVSAYRLMVPDAVPFRKSLNFAFQHGSNNRGDDLEYRWVAFWYQNQTTPLSFEVPNTLSADVSGEGGGVASTQTDSSESPLRWLIWVAPAVLIVVFITRAQRRRKSAPRRPE